MLLVVPALVAAFAGLVLFFYFFLDVPLPDEIGAEPTLIRDASGTEIATLQPEETREDVALAELPSHVVDAVLAAEDENFYRHGGVSLPGVFRAAVMNVASGEISQGGSTISQQYIKNVTREDAQTVMRKIREAALAVKLERRFSKNEILEFYLNSIYFGRGAYGIEAAATAYFGKEAVDLTRGEAAELAGLIPAPSAYDPIDNPLAAQRRYRYVLDRLVANGHLSRPEAERLADARPEVVPPGSSQFRDAPFYLDRVQRELAEIVGDEEAYHGLDITTNLDREVQQAAEEAYAARFADIEPTGALVAVDPQTGGIRALVGGKDYSEDQLNLALRPRETGSTFKPFALAAWVEQGLSPENYFDAPAEMTIEHDGPDSPWELTNFGGASYEKMSLREATWRSVNTVYAQLVMEIGTDKLADLARRAGVGKRLSEGHPASVLGTDDVSPLELAGGYATFASGGMRHQPLAVKRVERDGEVLFDASGNGERAFSEQVAWTVTDVLEGVVSSGTGTAADIGRPVAGKTGTSQNHGNAWFAGYTPQMAAVVWMGHRDSNESMPGEPTGGDLPAEVWADFMETAHEDLSVESFPAPRGSLRVTRPSPPPEPDCAENETLDTDEAGQPVCVEVEPEDGEEAEDGDEASEESGDSSGEAPAGSESGDPSGGAEGATPPQNAPAPPEGQTTPGPAQPPDAGEQPGEQPSPDGQTPAPQPEEPPQPQAPSPSPSPEESPDDSGQSTLPGQLGAGVP